MPFGTRPPCLQRVHTITPEELADSVVERLPLFECHILLKRLAAMLRVVKTPGGTEAPIVRMDAPGMAAAAEDNIDDDKWTNPYNFKP